MAANAEQEEAIEELGAESNTDNLQISFNVTYVLDALAAARAQARPGDRLLVFGSFHTAATALRELSASA